ncbi:LLM class flavin-dependent oxidoreductase [Pseudomonas sp. R3.Fl]|uniref:LLM class flavin-dependent oxidoreductase n=1 Tax=Pseudomonas sp. R3.Fl TaxID=2928708 RepID=UPI00201DF1C2|nr:LLM class flavin-dependent oxidoreductase [Pseudomonas sp. R3.Fl]MCL6691717.1 LLM class flavin-dependent oxidoreductase [Pseudomonas sp. R3.Fl]
MPLEIRGRLPSGPVPSAANNSLQHYLEFYLGGVRPFSAEVLVQAARDQEALGFDSSLFPQRATGPAVWPVVGWALAATRRLRVVAAHRVGLERPTVAARTLATLDRLSDGRVNVHFLQGRDETDLQRDGVFLDKAQRYASSAEYLEVFLAELSRQEPFDYAGDYYRVEGARSDVLPVQRPWPPLSIPGTSDAGIELAARFADIYSVPIATPETARRAIERIEPLARARGRRLGYWGDANIILGRTDEQAWAIAHQLADAIAECQAQQPLQEPSQDHGNARAALQGLGEAALHSGVWYPRLNALTGHGYTLVGSPQTLAEHLLGFYRLGVGILTLGGIGNRYDAQGRSQDLAEDLALLRELIERLRAGAARIDAEVGAIANGTH